MATNLFAAAADRLARIAGRRPLHVHLSVLFTLLILATGAVIGWDNFNQTSNIILSASADLFGRVGRGTVTGIVRLLGPLGVLADLMGGEKVTRTNSAAAGAARPLV